MASWPNLLLDLWPPRRAPFPFRTLQQAGNRRLFVLDYAWGGGIDILSHR